MKKIRILICDEDAEYVNALSSFLLSRDFSKDMDVSVSAFSDFKKIDNKDSAYDLALVSEVTGMGLGKAGNFNFKQTVTLTEDKSSCINETFFYKYQNVSEIIKILDACRPLQGLKNPDKLDSNGSVICVYSPGFHELSMPFSLSLCKLLSEENEVLFLDLEEISILPRLGEIDFTKDLTDLMYVLENESICNFDEYITRFEDFNILSPTAFPSELSYISESEWEKLLERAFKSGYKKVVILFGTLIQGFNTLCTRAERIIMLKKPGVFERIKETEFQHFLKAAGIETECIGVGIPFSSGNLSNGSLRLETLVNGAMLSHVRKEFSGKFEKRRD